MSPPVPSRFTRLYLARHGRVADPWPARLYGALDVPLSAAGARQSARIAALLEGVQLDAVLSSGLSRAEHTAELLRRPRGLERRDDPRLLEIDRGRWAGMGEAELEATQPGAWRAFWAAGGVEAPPGGEELSQVARRVRRALQDAADRHPGGALAVVAHKWVLRVAVGEALGLAPADTVRLDVPHSGLCVLDWPVAEARAGGAAPQLVAFGVDRLP